MHIYDIYDTIFYFSAANYLCRDQATSKLGSQPGDVIVTFNFPLGYTWICMGYNTCFILSKAKIRFPCG